LVVSDESAALTRKKKKWAVKTVTQPNRTALLRQINPKASRKNQAGSGTSLMADIPSAVTANRLRMSNFRSSLRKKTRRPSK
jgi:hypothetical protein